MNELSPYPPELWQARVQLRPGFEGRLEGFWRRSAGAGRGARAGVAAARAAGTGYDLMGFRPYRPGEDLRQLDWNLYARSSVPVVRVHRGEAGERWRLAFDTRAVMGVGRPSKLQLAAEVALAVAGVGVARGHQVDLAWPGGELRLARRIELASARAALGRLACDESVDARAVSRAARGVAADRLCLFADPWQGAAASWLSLARRGLQLTVVAALAPHELRPPAAWEHARWVDPADASEVSLRLDGSARARYAQRVDRELQRWSHAAAARRTSFFTPSTSSDFEPLARSVLRSWGHGG